MEPNNNMQDEEYFDSYNRLEIHRIMLQDKERTSAYIKGIKESTNKIKDKLVLDVGTGTGILAMLCAKVGAKTVYAVDASSIIDDSNIIISYNNMNDIIKLFKGKIEDLILPCKTVDVIVSEWMGSMLIFESMLLSVINARDRYLSKDGIMLPSKCDMLIAPLDVSEFISTHVDFWDDVYGFDMSALRPKAMLEFFSSPVFHRTIAESDLLADGVVFFSFETKTVSAYDVENILCNFEIKICKSGILCGFGCWFDVEFISTRLTTSPKAPETHWKHVTFVLDNSIDVQINDIIIGIISIRKSSLWGRHYDVTIKYGLKDSTSHQQKSFFVSGR